LINPYIAIIAYRGRGRKARGAFGFPLTLPLRAVFGLSAMLLCLEFVKKVITFILTSQSKATLEERNLLVVKLRMRGPQNHFWTAVAEVAA
jgi:hypothetical protein